MLLTSDTPVRAAGTVLTTAERLVSDRRAIASFFGDRADCERVAACVNVCVGVPTESLNAPLVPDLTIAIMARETGNKVLLDRVEYDRLKNAAQALSDAAGYINCSGPLVDRIRVMQTDHGQRVERMEGEIERLRFALGFYADPETWMPGEDDDAEAAIDGDTDDATVDLFIGMIGCSGTAPVSGARARAALAMKSVTATEEAAQTEEGHDGQEAPHA